MLKVRSIEDKALETVLLPDDLLTGYHSHPVKSEAELNHAIQLAQLDDVETVRVVLLRQGEKMVISIKPGLLAVTFDISDETPQPPKDAWSLGISAGEPPEVKTDGLVASREEQLSKPSAQKPTHTTSELQNRTNTTIPKHYKTTRVISTIIMYVGWFLVAVGVITLIISFLSGVDMIGMMGLLVSASPIMAGLFTVLIAQLVLAVVDVADNTRATHHLLAQDMLNRKD